MSRRLRNVTDLLAELVSIPSVNPHGDPGTKLVGEEQMALYLAEFLGELGAEVELKEIRPGRPNVSGIFRTRKAPKRRFAFAPHTDTVSVLGMTIPPFDPVIKNGRLYGRGATDTKGPMAAALWALSKWALSRDRIDSETEWTFTGLMGEEAGQEGSKAWGATNFKADLVLVLEPTSMKVVHAHKGATWLTISTKGRACHASIPDEGDNAILAMRRVLEVLEKKVTPYLRRQKHRALGHVTFNIGTIRGGSKINIVPDACEIECDIRTVPGFEGDEVVRLLRREVIKAVPGVKITPAKSAPALEADCSNRWVKLAASTLNGLTVAPWFCDAAFLAKPGRPAVAVGPGSIAQAHTKDEFIRIADLERGSEGFLKFIQATR